MDPEVFHLVEAWHWMYFETDLLFEGLSESNLHRRPTPALLAVSEPIAHVTRSEASIVYWYLFGQPRESLDDCLFRRPEFGWPPTMVESEVNLELAQMTVLEVTDEYLRQHARRYSLAQTIALPADYRFDDDWPRVATLRDRLRIAAYHVAYYAGQIYSVRHLLGEETPEN
jgi:hypothetical protein